MIGEDVGTVRISPDRQIVCVCLLVDGWSRTYLHLVQEHPDRFVTVRVQHVLVLESHLRNMASEGWTFISPPKMA